MIDVENERLRPLNRASAVVPSHPHTSTIVRWALRGVRGHRLETVVIGGRRYTSVEAIERFISALSNEPCQSEPLSRRREEEIDRAERKLDEGGFRARGQRAKE